jgi:hypothetical protein
LSETKAAAEGVLLVAAGMVLAWVFAMWGTGVLAAWSEMDQSVAPDRTVLAFTIIIAALVTLALAPLRNDTQVPFSVALKATGAAGGSGRRFRGRQKRKSRPVAQLGRWIGCSTDSSISPACCATRL